MTPSLRTRILLTVAPLVAIIAAVGVAGVFLLHNLGRRSEEIIRQNYISLAAMADLSGQLVEVERAVVGPTANHKSFLDRTAEARESCRVERGNVTVPGEREAADELTAAVEEVARQGEAVLAGSPPTEFRAAVVSAEEKVKAVRKLNERAMYAADRESQDTARWSAGVLAVASGVAVLLAGLAVWWLQRALLAPVRSMTAAARAIGGGDLRQLVPVVTRDEMGELAEEFNAMAAKLRALRQTDDYKLDRARRAAQATVDAFPDPVVVLDPGGRVEAANPAAVRLFGVGLAGSVWVLPDVLREVVGEAVITGRAVDSEGFDRAVPFTQGGEEHVYLPHTRPLAAPDGESLGVAVVLHDITRFRLLDQLKSDWVATVSHELKTPLTGVQLAVHVLLDEIVGPLTAKQTELLLEARGNTNRLMHLIQQLLALAKLEDDRRAFDRRPIDPALLLRTAADTVDSRAEDKHVGVSVDAAPDLPPVVVDATRFGQALNNLLDNALTHTAAGGTVSLRATAGGGVVTLTVADTGVGIPPADLPHVFERFYRVSGRDSPGTGLGLAIVREVVEGHGGSIRCESAEGKGTTFTITLPVGVESAAR